MLVNYKDLHSTRDLSKCMGFFSKKSWSSAEILILYHWKWAPNKSIRLSLTPCYLQYVLEYILLSNSSIKLLLLWYLIKTETFGFHISWKRLYYSSRNECLRFSDYLKFKILMYRFNKVQNTYPSETNRSKDLLFFWLRWKYWCHSIQNQIIRKIVPWFSTVILIETYLAIYLHELIWIYIT